MTPNRVIRHRRILAIADRARGDRLGVRDGTSAFRGPEWIDLAQELQPCPLERVRLALG